MRGNTITIVMSDKRGKMAKSIPLYQYDYGQKLIIENVELPSSYEVHFSNELHGEAVTSIGDSTGVDIPDQFLTTGKSVYLWLFLHDGYSDGETEYAGVIPVIKRAEPSDEEPTPVQQSAITQAIAALNDAVTATGTAQQTTEDARDAALAAQTAAETAQGLAEDAQDAAEAAQAFVGDHAFTAEAYATGKRDGVDVESDDPAYHNNAKYYSDQTIEMKVAAETAATNAEIAKNAIKDMTVSSSTLPAGYNATVAKTINPTTGKMNISFGIPRGPSGNESIDDTAGYGDTDRVWSADMTVRLAPKENPVFTDSISLGRKVESAKKTGHNSSAFGDKVIAMGWYSNVTGDNTIGMSQSGRVSGEYNVPEAEPWASGKQYHVGDIIVRYVEAAGVIRSILFFKCNTDHTSSNNEASDSAYWDNVGQRDMKYAEIVGNGYAEIDEQTFVITEHRSNARVLDWSGNERLKGDLYVECNADSTGGTKVAKITDIPAVASTTETQAIITEYVG